MEGIVTQPTPAGWPIDAGSIFVLAATIIVFMVPVFLIFPPIVPSASDALQQTHSKLGIAPARSNLRDQHSATFKKQHASSSRTNGAAATASIKSLFVYPVKSCRGIEVARSKVLPAGMEFDRLFTFAQLKSPFPVGVANGEADVEKSKQHVWDFITQRQFPLLATVEVELWQADLLKQKDKPVRTSEAFIILRFPWSDGSVLGWIGAKIRRGWSGRPEKEVMLPVEFPSEKEIRAKGYAYDSIKIWKETITALNMGSELPDELAHYLGVSNKLTLFRIDQLREVHRYAPKKEEAGYQPVTGFQDAYPLHLLSLSSVQDLESKLTKDDDLRNLDAQRFRANIFTSGTPAYDEDEWKMIKIKGEPSQQLEEAMFHVSCRTVRCKLPNVNQVTGIRHRVEPDKSIRAHRDVDESAPKSGCMGVQMVPLFGSKVDPEDTESYIEVGMNIEVVERGLPKPYIKQ